MRPPVIFALKRSVAVGATQFAIEFIDDEVVLDYNFRMPIRDFVQQMTPVMLEAFERIGGPFSPELMRRKQ